MAVTWSTNPAFQFLRSVEKQHLETGLSDHLRIFQGHFVFQRDAMGYFHGPPQGRPVAKGSVQGQCPPKFSISPKLLCPKNM